MLKEIVNGLVIQTDGIIKIMCDNENVNILYEDCNEIEIPACCYNKLLNALNVIRKKEKINVVYHVTF